MVRDRHSREQPALERAAVKRHKDLARQIKDQAMLTGLGQPELEVEVFEAGLDVIRSVHTEASPRTNWLEPLWTLPAYPGRQQDSAEIDRARAELLRMRNLAMRVLAGDEHAYVEALQGRPAFRELTELGSSIKFEIERSDVIECTLLVNGRDAIPTHSKSLTSTGKLSVKPMPKARFHEIYQDYVCSCVLRVAREVFAVLPIDLVIVTAAVVVKRDAVSADVETPVLSAAMPRAALDALDFDVLDPSDAIDGFLHRGDVMASRKSGEFVAVVPLRPKDAAPLAPSEETSMEELLTQVREMRGRLASLTGSVRPPVSPTAPS